jgi:adenylate cyclase
VAFVGAVGTADHVEFTALGDTVNVTARLASIGGPGEILVSEASVRLANLEQHHSDEPFERRRLQLRGKLEATDVVVLTVAPRPSN